MATPKFAIRNGDNFIGLGWECVSGRIAITYTGEQINVKCPIEVTDLNLNPIVDIDILDLVDSSIPNCPKEAVIKNLEDK